MKFAVTTVLILASLAFAMALECYTCHSSLNIGCGEDYFSPDYADKTTCDEGEMCMKVFTEDGVGRGCVPVEENNDCLTFTMSSTTMEICYCSTDLCNSASSNNLGLVLTSIAFLAMEVLN